MQEVNVTQQQDITFKCKKFYKIITNWGQETASHQYKVKSLKKRFQNAKEAVSRQEFADLLSSVNDTAYMFIMQQIKTQHLKPHVRRFTLDEKILALSIYKSSGKG